MKEEPRNESVNGGEVSGEGDSGNMEKIWREMAVIINHNARKASLRLKKSAEELGPHCKVYYTRTVEDARNYIKDLVENKTPHIFSAGGDGSFTQLANLLKEAYDEYKKKRESEGADSEKSALIELPKIGILKYGTGNGVASALGIKGGLKNINRVAGEGYDKVKKINLISSGEKVFPFAGIGIDAMVVNDFKMINSLLGHNKLWRKMAGGVLGYFATTFGYSAPKYLFSKKIKVEVVNTGNEVYSVALGEPPRRLPIKHGDIIYSGPATLLGAATVPNYGYGLKAFPFAFDKEGFMNLRIMNLNTLELVVNSPLIWFGKIKNRKVVDFLVQSVKIFTDRPVPYQIGGDAAGKISEVEYSVSDLSLHLFDFRKKPELGPG